MDLRNFTYLCYGLIAAWLVLVVYVITLVRREQRLVRELQRLQDQMSDRART